MAPSQPAATAQEVADRLSKVELQFTARAGEGGKLFGSITNQDIEKELREKGFDVDRRRIKLDEPIKSVGDHKVTVTLAAGVPCEISVQIAALDEPKDEAEPESAEASDGGAEQAAGEAAADAEPAAESADDDSQPA